MKDTTEQSDVNLEELFNDERRYMLIGKRASAKVRHYSAFGSGDERWDRFIAYNSRCKAAVDKIAARVRGGMSLDEAVEGLGGD